MGARKLDFVDRMRGLAILLVIAVHFTQVFATPAIRAIGALGQAGVQLFFVASAFTLCRSADQRGGEPRPALAFYIRRWFRIAPLYWLGILGYTALYLWAGKGDRYTPGAIAANALLIHGVVPFANNTIVPGGWTIGAEVLFYAAFPWVYPAIERSWRGRGARALAALVGTSLAIALGWQLAVRIATGAWIGNNTFPFCFIATQLPAFALGIAWYLVWRDRPQAAGGWGWAIVAAGAFAAGAAVMLLGIAPLYAALPSLAALAAVALGIGLSRHNGPRGALAAIGAASYSLYVLHFAVVWQPSAWVVYRFHGRAAAEWALAVPLYLADLAALMVLARITRQTIEEPANAIARALIRNLNKPLQTRVI